MSRIRNRKWSSRDWGEENSAPQRALNPDTHLAVEKQQDGTLLQLALMVLLDEDSEQPPRQPHGGCLGEVNFYLMIFRAH